MWSCLVGYLLPCVAVYDILACAGTTISSVAFKAPYRAECRLLGNDFLRRLRSVRSVRVRDYLNFMLLLIVRSGAERAIVDRFMIGVCMCSVKRG